MRTGLASSLKPLGAFLLAVLLCAGLAQRSGAITASASAWSPATSSAVSVAEKTAYRGVLVVVVEPRTGLFGADDPVDNTDPSGHDIGEMLSVMEISASLDALPNIASVRALSGGYAGPAIVGFFGADVWGSGDSNEGNQKMRAIANSIHAPIYRSLDIWDPYQYLLNHFKAGSSPNQPIKIFGHSWGGISAVKLARWLGRSPLRNHEIDVYTIDPVSTLRFPPKSVPSCVSYFWNRYQTAGKGVYIPGYGAVHGRELTSYAQFSDQLNLNPSDPQGLDHFSIIDAVQGELIQKLKN